jgi:HK97 family phage major capsid protein
MFEKKSFEELELMTAKELFEYRNAELEATVKESVEAAEKRMKDEIAKEDSNEATIEAMKSTIETLKANAIETGLRFKAIAEKKGNFEEVTDAISELKANMDKIKEIAKGGSEEIELKTIVAKATTLRADIVGNTQAQDVPGIGQLGSRRLTMYDIFRKAPMGTNNNGTLRYWDWTTATTVRAAEMVAEGVAFPESEAKWQEFTLTVKKIGDTLPVSAEFFEDEAMFAAELTNFLLTNVALIVDYQICYGAGTGTNMTGIFTTATAFSPSTVTHVEQPTMYDLIRVMREQITKGNGSKFNPDFCAMNISSINRMQLSKDANENYIMPPFVSRDGANVAGITIIESNVVNNDELIVGDSTKATIYEKVGVEVSRGTVDTQFTEDMETLKVRRRMALLVKNSDFGGFVKVTDIDAALAAIDITS